MNLFAELGKAARKSGLAMLPSEGEELPDWKVGQAFFRRQLANIRRLYCTEAIAKSVQDEGRRDIVVFVSSLLDLFAAYFGVTAATIILVQIYKIGVDRFCGQESSS